MRLASFTVDVDRDVNLPAQGRREGTSREAEGSKEPRFESSAYGAGLLIDLLNEMRIKGTFFTEAETLERIAEGCDIRSMFRGHEVASHGLAHEDYTGESTGMPMSAEEIAASIKQSLNRIDDLLGRHPIGFRSPYLHVNDTVIRTVRELGFKYDSSLEQGMVNGTVRPHEHGSGLIEVPVTYGRDGRGKKISSYLWPMHEGKRSANDYRGLIDQFEDGLLVLATHTWHMVETYQRKMTAPEIEKNVSNLREVLAHALDTGVEFMTIEAYVGKGSQ